MALTCPDCNASIEFCVEETILHKRIVDTGTGRLKRRVKKESQGNETQRALFQCTCCSWSTTDGSGDYVGFLNSCNSQDIEELLDFVQDKALRI